MSEPASGAETDQLAVWDDPIEAIVRTGGAALIFGASDSGKTTFATRLLNRAVAEGLRVAALDADVGQSEIGPPACIGVGFAAAPVHALSELPVAALAFVGGVSPRGRILQYAVAVRRLADEAEASLRAGLEERALLIVDTSGFVQGAAARSLDHALMDLIRPRHVVALQRSGEMEPVLGPIRSRDDLTVHRPPVPEAIGRKTAAFRAQRRQLRFASCLSGAQLLTLSMDDVAITGAWLGSGEPLAPHLHRFLDSSLAPGVRVFHAEMSGRHLGLMVNREIAPGCPGMALALQQLKAQSVTITLAPRLRHLLLGLTTRSGNLLALGTLEAIDFRRRTLGVLTTVRSPAAVSCVQFGGICVMPDGKECATLKPGELG
jgi:polynucleotide 5'-hydroxyl-kinase GRC3/NOL9